jgi:pimeloyl-ACP methyl ester carboxylesterase
LKNSPRQPKSSRRRRLARILFASAVVLLVLPVVLLHVASFLFSRHDRSMKPFAPRVVIDSFGHTLHCYELKQPDAEWDIIFIHGTPATAAVFGEQFRHPFSRANLMALDRPGFGASSPDRRGPSLEDQANAVGVLLTNEPTRRTILVGHSYGAPLALLAALKFTNEVAGVVLIGGSVDPAQERTYAIQRFADWPLISWLVPRSLRQCNRELLTLRGDLVSLQPQLSALAVPVVMLHGSKDRQVPVANVAYLRIQLAAAGKTNLFSQLVFPDYNHFIPWEHPDAVEAAIRLVTVHLSRPAQNQ